LKSLRPHELFLASAFKALRGIPAHGGPKPTYLGQQAGARKQGCKQGQKQGQKQGPQA